MKELLELFWVFFKMGCIAFGGGYALLPLITRELAKKRKWTTEKELLDFFALGQCTPGIIAINVATFVGNKRKGFVGGLFTTLGFIAPSVIIISLLATVILAISQNPIVMHAFAGVRICVCVLIFSAITKMAKGAIVDILTGIICAAVFFLATLTHISVIFLVLGAGIVGLVFKTVWRKKA